MTHAGAIFAACSKLVMPAIGGGNKQSSHWCASSRMAHTSSQIRHILAAFACMTGAGEGVAEA